MTIAKLGHKGRITIPAAVRSDLGLVDGDRVQFTRTKRGAFELHAVTQSVKQLKGMFAKPSRATISKMNAAIARRASQGVRPLQLRTPRVESP